ncbi:MAG: ribulose bisphosphate carboxylase small subunit, partial [Coleofasciculus sp. S288]|nr:ribulose bisphosphate carboxylase small subunit [Coleofasciculus sp. S288]
QSIDFYSALRSRIYDEQIRQFIYDVGFERVSSRLVNSAEASPEFPKPDFSLSRLIEFGNLLLGEQRRVDEMRLSREYNQALRQTEPKPVEATRPASLSQDGRTAIARDEIVNQPTSNNGSNGLKDSGMHNASVPNTPLDLETQEQIRELLAQGCRLGIEYANERRVRNNAWQSGESLHTNDASAAIIALAESLGEHTSEYVRLIGIDPKAKRRVLEKIIQRPN